MSKVHTQIQKFDPRTKRLETVATGLRVPVALAFNREGDLFNTDQEGETWMPNGNPLDELNHIILGRNYGFPPRHEKWLPDLVSEPPVVAFGPQHQSACGLVFNEARVAADVRRRTTPSSVPPPHVGGYEVPLPAFPAQGLFGPKWWEGDAFVAGESRGKIWRVRLVKTPHGYVGKSYTIARLDLLTLDLAISPKGDLYVCCHSGPPDWGTGPQGEGKIFKLSYTDPKAPQPVAVWPASPTEVRIAFDRPLDQFDSAMILRGSVEIEFGEYTSAGDRFEVLKPPYTVVEQQNATPKGKLAVRKIRLGDDKRVVMFTTEPHPLAVTYALTLRTAGFEAAYDFLGSSQHSSTETQDGRLLGSTQLVSWAPTNRASAGTDSRPVPKPQGDWEHGRELFTGTALNCAKCHRIRGEGGLTGPDLSNLIHRDARSVERDIREPSATLHPDYVTYLAELKRGDSLTGFIRSQSRTGSPSVADRGASSPRSPGDPNAAEPGRLAARPTLEDAVVLFDADGKDTVIPRADLANLHPTGQSLMPTGLLDTLKPDDVRDLLTFLLWEPPVRTKAEAERVLAASSPSPLGGEKASERDNPTAALKQPTPLPALSPPVGSGEGKASDPLRIVLVASKQDHGPGQHDYPRWQEKWKRLLSSLSPTSPSQPDAGSLIASATVPLSPGERDRVRAGQPSQPDPAPSTSAQSSQSLLTSAPTNVSVETAWEWPTAGQFTTADVLVFYFWNHDWSPARYAQFDAYQKRGGGVVILHSACIADREPEKLAERIGLSATPGTVSYRHMPFDLIFEAKDHPLVRGLPELLHFLDEPYWPLIGDPSRVTVLANGQVDGAPKPLVWTFERAGADGRTGRVFGSILGHYFWTLDDPLYRLLVLRGIAWAGGADLNRLADAALLEAAVK